MESVYWIILWIQLIVNTQCIVLGSSGTADTQTSAEFQQLLDIFHNETGQLRHFVSVLETELADVKLSIQQKLNKTEEEVKKLNTELQSEKSERIQMQRENDDLVFKFFNLTLNYNSLLSTMHVLQNENTLMKNNIQNLTGRLNGVDFSNVMSDHSELLQMKQKLDYAAGFSASNSTDGPVNGTITFRNISTNVGKHYDPVTGQFTCNATGLYFFTLTVVKWDNADHAWCYIRKNGHQIVQAGIDLASGPDGNWYEATNSALLHLQSGDIVDLGGCSEARTMYSDTTFTGFLVKLD